MSALTAFGIVATMSFPVAAYFLAKLKYNEARNAKARTWPTVPGTIRSSSVERKIAAGAVMWALDVRYVYTAAGETHMGEALGFAPRYGSDKDLVLQLAQKYPADAAVTVYYDPASPNVAVLETSDALAGGRNWSIWLGFAAPIIIALFMMVRHV